MSSELPEEGHDRPSMNSSQPRTRRKRVRAVTSCVNCHQRKQKCDRGTPCTNCMIRRSESTCRYEMFPPGKLPPGESIFKLKATRARPPDLASSSKTPQSGTTDTWTVLGFSDMNPDTSLGLFRAVEPSPDIPSSPRTEHPRGSWEWYKAALRQLPPPEYINQLANAFFTETNWQYSPLDLEMFTEQKARWDQLPYSELAKGPQTLAPEIRFFPAILFQLLSLALLHWDLEDTAFESLKFKADMSLEEVAREYSEAGATLLSSLGKHDLCTSVIQAGFLRTLFLKTTGRVLESWNSLGETIEKGRLLQWHMDVTPDERTVQSAQDWRHSQIRRKTWLNICTWDAHMSAMLGRPVRVSLRDMDITPPVDSPLIQGQPQMRPLPRNDYDAPTPLTVQTFYFQIANFLLRIPLIYLPSTPELERSERIQALHEEILYFREHLPPFMWVKNPDRTFDDLPECFWMTDARDSVEAAVWFTILALHRPQIFKDAKNRSLATKAGLHTLRSQTASAADAPLRKSWSFAYLFSTFDAAVTVAALYILFPKDSPRHLEEATSHIKTVTAHFMAMSKVNSITKTAATVLQAMLVRLERATMTSRASFSGSIGDSTSPTSASTVSSDRLPELDDTYAIGAQSCSTGFAPIAYNFEGISPPAPLYDLLHDGLSCLNANTNPMAMFPGDNVYDVNLDWQFQGHFDNDAFWNIMNNMDLP